jgi:hypothetical protein
MKQLKLSGSNLVALVDDDVYPLLAWGVWHGSVGQRHVYAQIAIVKGSDIGAIRTSIRHFAKQLWVNSRTFKPI